jgi:hypothetical protein
MSTKWRLPGGIPEKTGKPDMRQLAFSPARQTGSISARAGSLNNRGRRIGPWIWLFNLRVTA